MVHVMPNTTTLILDFGTKFTKVGYAGDYSPILIENTEDLMNSESHQAYVLKSIEKYSKEFLVDSIIIIENGNLESKNENSEIKKNILKHIFINKICGSILFLQTPICDAFGHGKVSCTVLNCSASSMTASTILNGKVVETHREPIGSIILEEHILKIIKDKQIPEILSSINSFDNSSILHILSGSKDSNLAMQILDSEELIGELEEKYKIQIFESIRTECYNLIDKIIQMRNNYKINKKNTSNGCIILSGGLFRYKSFVNFVKRYIFNLLSEDFSDFILRDKALDCTFLGASIFGMNDKTKALYISSNDFQNIGTDILKSKNIGL